MSERFFSRLHGSACLAVAVFMACCCPVKCGVTDEAAFFVSLALRESPAARQALQRSEQARARLEETTGFYDPRLTGTAGFSGWSRSIPGGSASFLLPDNAGVAQAAFDVPLPPGMYVSAGAAERYFRRIEDTNEPYYQTLLGVQLRMPLWRDFGFRQWRRERDQASFEAAAAETAWRATCHDLRHRVELAHIVAREALAGRWVAGESQRRAESLLNEAEELARQKTIPLYQVYPARMELDLRRQETLEADRICNNATRELAALVGGNDDWTLSDKEDDLSKLAAAAMDMQTIAPGAALAGRASYVELILRARAAEALLAKMRDDLKADVSLNAGVVYQGENESNPWGDRTVVSHDPFGGEVTLVLKRAWGLRAERARAARQAATLAEWRERIREEQLQIERNLQMAYTQFVSVKEEIAVLDRAVRSARETLDAEQERFRLGEGRSRNVLDAQKDLTSVLNRRNKAAALLLRARSDYRFAGGYPAEDAARAAGKGQ